MRHADLFRGRNRKCAQCMEEIEADRNRLKMLRVDQTQVANLFLHNYESLVVLPLLPDEFRNAEVLYVHHDQKDRCFCFVFWSENFDPVPTGMDIPAHPDIEGHRTIVLRKQLDGSFRTAEMASSD
jgi:hypothetical protein